jgi:hypothetical protein
MRHIPLVLPACRVETLQAELDRVKLAEDEALNALKSQEESLLRLVSQLRDAAHSEISNLQATEGRLMTFVHASSQRLKAMQQEQQLLHPALSQLLEDPQQLVRLVLSGGFVAFAGGATAGAAAAFAASRDSFRSAVASSQMARSNSGNASSGGAGAGAAGSAGAASGGLAGKPGGSGQADGAGPRAGVVAAAAAARGGTLVADEREERAEESKQKQQQEVPLSWRRAAADAAVDQVDQSNSSSAGRDPNWRTNWRSAPLPTAAEMVADAKTSSSNSSSRDPNWRTNWRSTPAVAGAEVPASAATAAAAIDADALLARLSPQLLQALLQELPAVSDALITLTPEVLQQLQEKAAEAAAAAQALHVLQQQDAEAAVKSAELAASSLEAERKVAEAMRNEAAAAQQLLEVERAAKEAAEAYAKHLGEEVARLEGRLVLQQKGWGPRRLPTPTPSPRRTPRGSRAGSPTDQLNSAGAAPAAAAAVVSAAAQQNSSRVSSSGGSRSAGSSSGGASQDTKHVNSVALSLVQKQLLEAHDRLAAATKMRAAAEIELRELTCALLHEQQQVGAVRCLLYCDRACGLSYAECTDHCV